MLPVIPHDIRELPRQGPVGERARAIGFNDSNRVHATDREPVVIEGGNSVEESGTGHRDASPTFAVPCQDGPVMGETDDPIRTLYRLKGLAVTLADMRRVLSDADQAAF